MKMKKFVLWTLAVSILSLCVGLGITAYCGSFQQQEKAIDLSETAAIDAIELIKIESSSADIFITPTEESQASLRYYGTLRSSGKNSPSVEVDQVGKDLKIKSGMPLGIMWYTTADFDGFKLEIKIPSSYHNKLEVQTNFGDIELSSLALEKIAASTGSKGSVKITNCQGEQEVNAALGNIAITDNNLSSNKTIKTTLGDINLFLPENSNFSYIYNTTSGNINNGFSPNTEQNNKEHIFGTVGNGKYNITARTNSGNLNISKSN